MGFSCLMILLASTVSYGGVVYGQKSNLTIEMFEGVKEGDSIRFYFVLSDRQGHDGQAHLKILDNVGTVLFEEGFEVRANDYTDYMYALTGTTIGKAYEWYVRFGEIKKGIGDALGYGKAQFQFTTGGKELNAKASVEIPSFSEKETIAVYENRYMKTSTLVDQKVVKGDFEVTLVRLGYYRHLQYETFGDEVTDFRVDIKVKNIGSEEETFGTYNAAIVIGSSQYDASFGSKLDVYNMRPGVIREGYLLFETPTTLSGIGQVIVGSYYSYPEGEIEYKFTFDFDNLTKEISFVPKVQKLKVRIDKSSYLMGESVKISGKVLEVSSAGGSVVVLNSKGEVYSRFEFHPNADGSFVTQFELKESRMAIPGVWKVKVSYLSEASEATITVNAKAPTKPLVEKEEEKLVKLKMTARQKGDSVLVRAKSSALSQGEIYELHLTFDNGNIKSVKPPRGWDFEIDKETRTIELFTDDNPLKPGKSIRFKVQTDATQLSGSWVALDEDAVEVASGSMKARLARA